NKRAAELARQAADELSTPQKPRYVAGSMGPTTKAITVTGGVTFEQLREAYYVQAKGLVEGGVDVLLVETCQDTRNIKAATLAIRQLSETIGAEVPFIISVTIEPMGTMLAGQMVEGKKPRQRPAEAHRAVYSGIETIEAEESTRPLLVGERTNVIGSRLFKNLVAEEKWEEASEIARRQVRGGAHIVDVCLQ